MSLFDKTKIVLNEAINHEKENNNDKPDNEQLYALCLDDYSSPSFISSEKPYIGTIEDIINLLNAIKSDELFHDKFPELFSAFDRFLKGEKNIIHNVALRKVQLLAPVIEIDSTASYLENTKFKHINTWGFPYEMQFERTCNEHIWISYKGKYYRCIRAKIKDLKYKNSIGQYTEIDMAWGFPRQIEFENNTTYNRLYVTEKVFEKQEDVLIDIENFKQNPDPIFTEILNDIFGDG